MDKKKTLGWIAGLGAVALLVFTLVAAYPNFFGLAGSTWFSFHGDPGRTGFSLKHSPGEDRVAWTYELKKVSNSKGVILGSPAVSEDKVFFGAMNGKVYALDLETGTEVWTFSGEKSFWASSPTVHDGKVFIGCQDKYLYALDAETGQRVWRYKTNGPIGSSSPTVDNGKVFVGSEDGYLYALKEDTGSLVWKENLGEKIYSSPAVHEGHVYIGVDSPNNGTYELHCLAVSNGDSVWVVEAEEGNKFTASPSAYAKTVYIGGTDGKIYAFKYASGDLMWSKNLLNHEITATPAIAYDRVYITNWGGQLVSLEKNNGHIYWRYDTNKRIEGSPIVAEKKICAGNQAGTFYCIDRAGALIWKKKLPGKITASAATSAGMIIVVSHTETDSTITAFGRYHSND